MSFDNRFDYKLNHRLDHKKDIPPKYLLLALSIACIILMVISYFAPNTLKPVKAFTGKFIVPMQEGVNKIGEMVNEKMIVFSDIEKLEEENAMLKEKVASYENDISRYQTELSELEELRSLYDLSLLYPDYNVTVARVFSTNSSSWFNEFYIDKGMNQGIYENCNVLCNNGLLGIVIESYDNYAKVRAIIDDRTNVTCEVTPDNALCNLEGSLSTIEDNYLYIKDIDKDAIVNIGDKVVTSGVSEKYFYGLTVGYVQEITMDSNNLTKTAKITPAVDFSNVNDVLVITDRKTEVSY